MRRQTPIPNTNPQGEVLAALRAYVDNNFASDRAAAESLGYSTGHLSSILNGKKIIPKPLCKLMGYEQRWVKMEDEACPS